MFSYLSLIRLFFFTRIPAKDLYTSCDIYRQSTSKIEISALECLKSLDMINVMFNAKFLELLGNRISAVSPVEFPE